MPLPAGPMTSCAKPMIDDESEIKLESAGSSLLPSRVPLFSVGRRKERGRETTAGMGGCGFAEEKSRKREAGLDCGSCRGVDQNREKTAVAA